MRLRSSEPHDPDATLRTNPLKLRRLRMEAARQARLARREAALLVPLIVGVLLVYNYRDDLPGPNLPVRVACVIALVVLGLAFARDIGRAAEPIFSAASTPRQPARSAS